MSLNQEGDTVVLRALLKVQLGWGALPGWVGCSGASASSGDIVRLLHQPCPNGSVPTSPAAARPANTRPCLSNGPKMTQNGPNRPRCPSAPSSCVDDCPKFALIMVAQLSLVLPTPVWTTSPPPPPRDLQTGAGIANGMVLLPLNRVASFLQTCRAELAVALFGVWPTQLAKPLTVHSVSNHDLFVS